MLLRSKQMDGLDRVDDQVQSASAVTADLVSSVIAAACERLPVLDRTGKAARLHSLIESGAWTDVALGVVEIDLPQWKLRRLVFEDGKWVCSLSKQAYLPLGLDDSVDARHELLPLAILGALLEARRDAITTPESQPTVPQLRSAPGNAFPRDNFFWVIPCENFR